MVAFPQQIDGVCDRRQRMSELMSQHGDELIFPLAVGDEPRRDPPRSQSHHFSPPWNVPSNFPIFQITTRVAEVFAASGGFGVTVLQFVLSIVVAGVLLAKASACATVTRLLTSVRRLQAASCMAGRSCSCETRVLPGDLRVALAIRSSTCSSPQQLALASSQPSLLWRPAADPLALSARTNQAYEQ
jgi:hypothetical protein